MTTKLTHFFNSALLFGLLTLLGSPTALAQGQSGRVPIPDPTLFLSNDTISFAVLSARADDIGFREILDITWSGLQNAQGSAAAPFMKFLLKAIQGHQGDEQNALISFLPMQMVRADALPPNETVPNPTIAVTVAGWPGLQQLFLTGMSRSNEGEQFPSEKTEHATLIFREGWGEPGTARVLTRLAGTFVGFPDRERALKGTELLAKNNTSSVPKSKVKDLLSDMDTSRNTYGVLLNRDGSLLNFLRWLNSSDTARAEAKVGPERLNAVLEQVEAMTWEGDLLTADEFEFHLRFFTTSEEARRELTEVLKEVRGVLDDYGRAGEMQATGLDKDVYVVFTMVGYREMLQNYLKTF